MKRHPADPLSFVAGLAFVLVGLFALTGEVHLLVDGEWIWPVVLIAGGIALLATIRRDRSG